MYNTKVNQKMPKKKHVLNAIAMEVWYRHASGKKDENHKYIGLFLKMVTLSMLLWGQKMGVRKIESKYTIYYSK